MMSAPAPASRYRVLAPARIRAGPEPGSADQGVAAVGDVLYTLDGRRSPTSGALLVQTSRGWLSTAAGDGSALLEAMASDEEQDSSSGSDSDGDDVQAAARRRFRLGAAEIISANRLSPRVDLSPAKARGEAGRRPSGTGDGHRVASSYVCVNKAQIRAGFEKDSRDCGILQPGERIEMDGGARVTAGGVLRIHFERGWVSTKTADGTPLLRAEDSSSSEEESSSDGEEAAALAQLEEQKRHGRTALAAQQAEFERALLASQQREDTLQARLDALAAENTELQARCQKEEARRTSAVAAVGVELAEAHEALEAEQRRSAAAIAEVDEAKSAARRSAEGAQEELRAARDRLQAVREEMIRPRFDRACRLADLTSVHVAGAGAGRGAGGGGGGRAVGAAGQAQGAVRGARCVAGAAGGGRGGAQPAAGDERRDEAAHPRDGRARW